MNHLSRTLLLQAPNNRHGISLEPQRARVSPSDVQDIVHMGVPGSITSPWESAAGGIGRDEESAQLAAIGEAVERYCATLINLPLKSKQVIPEDNRVDPEEWHLFTDEQRQQPGFPFGNIYTDACMFTNVFDFQDNREFWVPHPLVALRDDYQTGVPTSSGLAAGPTAFQALLRAIQELIERDALMTTWLHSVPARAIAVPEKYADAVSGLHGEMWAFDLTPAYSPFPVIAVAGGIPKRGKWRYSLGVACRESWQDALEKAYLEWNQGVLFAGIYESYVDTDAIDDPYTLKSFDEHAIFYTLHPESWHDLPMFRSRHHIQKVSVPGRALTTAQALRTVKAALRKHKIRLYYRDLTTIDAEQLGLRVVRAASPDMAPIFAHQEWPLLGRIEGALAGRYPWAAGKSGPFPNLMPHPLG
jgi:ribosomal protein S12 methylthiotransferase accessory factor